MSGALKGLLRLMSACCPLDVRLLSAFKADNKRTSSGQQADINQCWYGGGAKAEPCFSGGEAAGFQGCSREAVFLGLSAMAFRVSKVQ